MFLSDERKKALLQELYEWQEDGLAVRAFAPEWLDKALWEQAEAIAADCDYAAQQYRHDASSMPNGWLSDMDSAKAEAVSLAASHIRAKLKED